jgi:hypothetical protein
MAGRVCLFQAFGAAGWLAGCLLAAMLAHSRGRDVWFVPILAVTALVSQAAFVLVRGALRGGWTPLVLYRHGAVFALSCVGTCIAGGQPVRAWLDIVAPAFFLFLSFGRIGCWTAGCCHGRPSRIGFGYDAGHAEAVHADLRGIRLWPVQLVEAVIAFAIALLGAAGTSFAACAAAYAGARFLLEYFRGEPGRDRVLGLTEAQWTSAGLLLFTYPPGLAVLGIALLFRPLPPEHEVQLAYAIVCTRRDRTVATTSFGVTLTRKAGTLRILSPVTPRVRRRIAVLDELVCGTRKG